MFRFVARLVRLLKKGEPGIGPIFRDLDLMSTPFLEQAAIKKLSDRVGHHLPEKMRGIMCRCSLMTRETVECLGHSGRIQVITLSLGCTCR